MEYPPTQIPCRKGFSDNLKSSRERRERSMYARRPGVVNIKLKLTLASLSEEPSCNGIRGDESVWSPGSSTLWRSLILYVKLNDINSILLFTSPVIHWYIYF